MGDIYQARWRISVQDVISEVHLHYEQSAGGDTATIAQSAATAIQAHYLAELRDCLAVDSRVESLYVRKITGITRPAWLGNFNNAVGTNAGLDAISAQNCLLINLRNTGGLLKRSGRIFLSGCPKTGIAAGVWAGAFLNVTVPALLAKLIAIPAGGTDGWAGDMVVMRTVIDGVPQDPAVAVPVDAVDATPEVGTIHSRKGKLTGYATDVTFP